MTEERLSKLEQAFAAHLALTLNSFGTSDLGAINEHQKRLLDWADDFNARYVFGPKLNHD